jgi:hypothetical protein
LLTTELCHLSLMIPQYLKDISNSICILHNPSIYLTHLYLYHLAQFKRCVGSCVLYCLRYTDKKNKHLHTFRVKQLFFQIFSVGSWLGLWM